MSPAESPAGVASVVIRSLVACSITWMGGGAASAVARPTATKPARLAAATSGAMVRTFFFMARPPDGEQVDGDYEPRQAGADEPRAGRRSAEMWTHSHRPGQVGRHKHRQVRAT